MMKFITMMAIVCLSVHAGRKHCVRVLEAPFSTEACVLVDRHERAVRRLTLPAGSDVVASTLRSGSTCEYFGSRR